MLYLSPARKSINSTIRRCLSSIESKVNYITTLVASMRQMAIIRYSCRSTCLIALKKSWRRGYIISEAYLRSSSVYFSMYYTV